MSPATDSRGVGELDERTWKLLLGRLGDADRRCTPILGPELSYGSIRARATLARTWAKDLEFPFEERHDLPRVAQYAATMLSAEDARKDFLKYFKANPAPLHGGDDDAYHILAQLPFPLYLTTNYDSLLFQALEQRKEKKPRQDYCRWKDDLHEGPTAFDPPYERHVANPVIFHVYGHFGRPDSLVLTEDDYLDFLETVAGEPHVVPAPVGAAKNTALLFLGYRLRDLDFRVLLRFLNLKQSAERRKIHLCVQLTEDPGDPEARRGLSTVEEFLEECCDQLRINVYFGTCHQFLSELHKRWKDANRDN
jgi:SIR2-like domain